MIPDKAFFINPHNFNGDTFYLDQEESIHATRVLRLKIGDDICLLNGIGTGYFGKIDSLETHVSGSILKTIDGLGENKYSITLAAALIKRDRFELLLEKATELGVNVIQPLILDRSVKKKLNFKRCQKLIISASKQCRRSRFPDMKNPIALSTLLKNGNQIVCARMNAKKSLSELSFDSTQNIVVVIGPEGDFSKSEIDLIDNSNVQCYHLGDRRLRAETAALNSLSILNEILN